MGVACSRGAVGPAPIASTSVASSSAAAPPSASAFASASTSASASASAVAPEPPPCGHGETDASTLAVVHEPHGPRKLFSWDGLLETSFPITRTIDGHTQTHCVRVLFPPADHKVEGRTVRAATRIDAAWLRLLENTLARIPFDQASLLDRFVIDNRPTEHGIAPFDRRDEADARDGHTIWLHERLFLEQNHWMHGNFGHYWSYHLDRDATVVDDQPADHAFFSPVLLHEIGHLVAYAVVNGDGSGDVPACARMCGDRHDCAKLTPAEQEQGCISAYCMPFHIQQGSENWAEQYRFYFQSKITRELLVAAKSGCVATLRDGPKPVDEGLPAPWDAGLPDIANFHRTKWASCDEQQCKKF